MCAWCAWCVVPHTHTDVTLLLFLSFILSFFLSFILSFVLSFVLSFFPRLLPLLHPPQVRNGVVGLISKGQAMIAPLQAQASEQYNKVAAQIEPTIAKVS